MNDLGKISLFSNSTNFGAIYSKNNNEQTSIVKVNDPQGCRMYAWSKVVKLANLVPEDEFINITKDNREADGRNITSLCTLGGFPNSTLVIKTSTSFPKKVHKKIADLLESIDIKSFDINNFIKNYKKDN